MTAPPGPTKPRAHGTTPDGFVVVVSAASGVTTTPVSGGVRARLGRAPDCEVVIDHDSVSRYHASVVAGEAVEVADDASTNGTFVAGKRLARGERATIALGTPIAVGDTVAYVLPAHAAAPPTRAAGALDDVVRDPAMLRLYALVDVFAPSPLNVLILGETGVGKEVYAEAIHRRSRRADGPFLKLNCAALPESILEAELFGYDKGAFTGADRAKPGLFEAATGGTVLLDEIGDMPLATQAKLLRVLESGEVLRLGSVSPITVDVRFVSATHADLRARADAGTFRADLYFRLDGATVELPPLRSRAADIEPLARLFAGRIAKQLGRATPELAADAVDALVHHPWPGNVRELRNVVERAVVLCGGSRTIEATHLPSLAAAVATAAASARPPSGLREALDQVERDNIVRALELAAGNQTRAAKALGISRHALIDRLARYGLARPRKK